MWEAHNWLKTPMVSKRARSYLRSMWKLKTPLIEVIRVVGVGRFRYRIECSATVGTGCRECETGLVLAVDR